MVSSSEGDENERTPPRVEKRERVPSPENGSTKRVKSRTGGVYIPPFKLAQMQQENETKKSSKEHQRQTWDALRKSINGLINKVNVTNIKNILPELFQENLVRGRGLFARAIMKAQLASPGFTHIYAALLAVLNTKMPENGELLLKRVVMQFRRSYKRRDKVVTIALVRFIAHLVNQQVVHELLALEVLTLLLEHPTDDSVEVAVNLTKECGQILAELCPPGLHAIFERFRGILHEGEIDKRVQYTIEGLFAIRKGGFSDYPAIHEELDLVETSDQITHEISLEDEIDKEELLDVFRYDPDYEKNELMWTQIKKEILGESDDESDGDSSDSGSGSESDDESESIVPSNQTTAIQDFSEQDLVNFRRKIYLALMSSLGNDDAAHRLLRMNISEGQEKELCSMIIECCIQKRTFERFFASLGQRFCQIKQVYQDAFEDCFKEQYATIHRLETNKLRNMAKFFAHLLFTDALPWTCLECIRLNEEDTTSSSRIFIKILCQELSEEMGIGKLKERLLDDYMKEVFAGLMPKENPRNTRFAINFYTSIGLGGLTDELRDHLKNAPKMILSKHDSSSSSSSSSSDSSSSSGSSSSSSSSGDSDSSSSSSDSSSSDEEEDKRTRVDMDQVENTIEQALDQRVRSSRRSNERKGVSKSRSAERSHRHRRSRSEERSRRSRHREKDRRSPSERTSRRRRDEPEDRSERKKDRRSAERSSRRRRDSRDEADRPSRERTSRRRRDSRDEADRPPRESSRRRKDSRDEAEDRSEREKVRRSAERSSRRRRDSRDEADRHSAERTLRRRRDEAEDRSERKKDRRSAERSSRRRKDSRDDAERRGESSPKKSEDRRSRERSSRRRQHESPQGSPEKNERSPRRDRRSRERSSRRRHRSPEGRSSRRHEDERRSAERSSRKRY